MNCDSLPVVSLIKNCKILLVSFFSFFRRDSLLRTLELTASVATEAQRLLHILSRRALINESLWSLSPARRWEDGLWQADGSWRECARSSLPWHSVAHLPTPHYVVARQQHSDLARHWRRPFELMARILPWVHTVGTQCSGRAAAAHHYSRVWTKNKI